MEDYGDDRVAPTKSTCVLATAPANPRSGELVTYRRDCEAILAANGLAEIANGRDPASLAALIDYEPRQFVPDHVIEAQPVIVQIKMRQYNDGMRRTNAKNEATRFSVRLQLNGKLFGAVAGACKPHYMTLHGLLYTECHYEYEPGLIGV